LARLKKAGWYLHQLVRALVEPTPAPTAEVYLDVEHRSRRFLLLAHLFHGAGVSLRVHWTWKQFLPLNQNGYGAFSLAGVVLKVGRRARSNSVLTISDGSVPLPRRPRKLLQVKYSPGSTPNPLPERTIFIPISFHPNLMSERWYERAHALAQGESRSMLGFFAGNFDPAVYDKAHFQTEYGMLNRYQVLQIVLSPEFREWVYEPTSWEQFENDRRAGLLVDRFVVIDVRRFSVPQELWLETLSQAQYFLAPPGYTQPFSHNVVEALSVGTVPILNYGHLFRPQMVNEVDVLAFDTEDSLRRLLRRLRDRQTPSWIELKNRAWLYQRNNLSPQSIAQKIRELLADPSDQPWNMVLAGSIK